MGAERKRKQCVSVAVAVAKQYNTIKGRVDVIDKTEILEMLNTMSVGRDKVIRAYSTRKCGEWEHWIDMLDAQVDVIEQIAKMIKHDSDIDTDLERWQMSLEDDTQQK